MIHTPAEILAQYLIDQGVFSDPTADEDWPVFVGFLPDGGDVPANCAVVYDQAGIKDGRYMDDGISVMHPGLQVRVRSDVYTVGWVKAEEANDATYGVKDESVIVDTDEGQGQYTLTNVSPQGPTLSLGYDQGSPDERSLFTINYLATLTEEVLVLTGDISTAAHAASAAIGASAMKGQFHSNAGAGAAAIILDLPVAADGLHGRFVQIDTGVLEINPQAGDSISYPGEPAVLAAGESLKLKNRISAVYIYSDGNNRWIVVSMQGTVIPDSED